MLMIIVGASMLLFFVWSWWMYILELLLLGKVVSEVE